MADKVKIENLFLHLGPNNEYHGQKEEEFSEEDLQDVTEILCDLMCGSCEDDGCYSDEEVEGLVDEMSEKFGLSKKKAKEIADFIFDWAERH